MLIDEELRLCTRESLLKLKKIFKLKDEIRAECQSNRLSTLYVLICLYNIDIIYSIWKNIFFLEWSILRDDFAINRVLILDENWEWNRNSRFILEIISIWSQQIYYTWCWYIQETTNSFNYNTSNVCVESPKNIFLDIEMNVNHIDWLIYNLDIMYKII